MSLKLPRLMLVLTVAFGALPRAQQTSPPPLAAFDQRGFSLLNSFCCERAYTDPAAANNLRANMANGVSLGQPVDAGMTNFVTTQNTRLLFEMPGASKVAGASETEIAAQRQALGSLCQSRGPSLLGWNLMSEWDQGGGHWVPGGRPRYDGLTRPQAYSRFVDYYLNNSPPLGTYLREPRSQRSCQLVAQTDIPGNVAFAYEMGVDVTLLERSIDELSDISTGIAFARGASRQYDRRWGIDISTWRTSNDAATQFNSQGTLTGGWSPSYLRRHLYVSYMSGAHIVNIEPSIYYSSSGALNPLGQMTRDFGDFALRRHPDVGRPVVPIAVMMDFYHGFDPKHWLYSQGDAVWYGDIPYSAGDYMVNNFFKVAYPGHWLHGLTPNAPFLNSAGEPDPVRFQQYLSAGNDPRPYEPMGSTRWGDSLDVILTNSSLATLQQYKVIVLLGGVVIDNGLRSLFQTWVQQGGVLVLNAGQVSAADEGLLGVTLGQTVRTAATSTWVADNTNYQEAGFQYQAVTPGTASVLARTGQDPLITSNTYGSGRVILTAPLFLQSSDRSRLLDIGARLFDSLQLSALPARVSGPPVQYIVNQAPGKVIVTLVNNSSTTWTGGVIVDMQGSVAAVREYVADTSVSFTTAESAVTVSSQVPAYDVRVYAVEFRVPTPAQPGNLRILK